MKRLEKSSSWMGKTITIIVMLLFFAINAGATDYYYYAKADADLSAGGKVYISTTQTGSPNYQKAPMELRGSGSGIGSYEQTFNFYATNNVGFTFKGWRNSSGTIVSTVSPYNFNVTVNGGRNNRTQVVYTAVFEAMTGLVQAYTSDATRGMVVNSNESNKVGDEIVITALPDASQGIKFLGWKTQNSESAEFVSKDNPLNITVEGEATYYAFFTEPATMVYCILKNHKTDKVLSLYGDGAALEHTTNFTYNNKTYTILDGFDFKNGLKMISLEAAKGNPMTVFKRKSATVTGTLEEGDLATDVSMTSGSINTAISIAALVKNTKYTDLSFELQNDGTYRIYTNITNTISTGGLFSQDYTFTRPSYLYDDGTDFAHLRSTNDMSADDEEATYWDIYFLTEDQVEGAFGAYAKSKFTQDKKYFTSMYAPFAYKLLDGVTAYYLPYSSESYNEEKNKVVFTAISSGSIVPANTAVILECENADDPTANRLLPVSDESTIAAATNQLLKGYTQLWSNETGSLINTVANSDLRYDLSMNKENKLGFYHYSGKNMNPNKAFLELPVSLDELAEYLNNKDTEGLAKSVTFSFGKETNHIELQNIIGEDEDAPIFDLQGRKVKTTKPGIYVKKGKKFVVK